MPQEMSRRCVPYTPPWKPLREMTIAIVSTAGVHARDQEPFHTEGDATWRVIPGDVASGDLVVTHGAPEDHYDRSELRKDINVIFPIDPLRELARDGFIGGVAEKHFSMMGYALKLRQFYDEAAPAVAKQVELSGCDGVVLTAG